MEDLHEKYLVQLTCAFAEVHPSDNDLPASYRAEMAVQAAIAALRLIQKEVRDKRDLGRRSW
jgi:hypothetical protein